MDFDAGSASVADDERRIGSDLRRDDGIAQFVLSDSTLIYATGAPYGHRRLALVSRGGAMEELAIPAARILGASFSPDGSQLALAIIENQSNIWVYDLGTMQRRKLTGGGNNFGPHWSAGGASIYFTSDRDGQASAVYRTSPDSGPGDAVRVFEYGPTVIIQQLHAGDVATVSLRSGDIGNDLYLVDLGAGAIRPVASRPDHSEGLANLSPDGGWLALTVDATGRSEVVIQPVDGDVGPRVRVSREGGEEPVWAPDMSELYYRYGSRLYAVSVSLEGGRPKTGQPEVIFDIDRWRNIPGFSYWRNPADGRFLILLDDQPSTSRSLRVIEGWRNAGTQSTQ